MSDYTESGYLDRTDQDGEGEAAAEEALREALRDIDSTVCECGASKTPGQPFCPVCYFALPRDIRTKLYRVKLSGDTDLYDLAKKWLAQHAKVSR